MQFQLHILNKELSELGKGDPHKGLLSLREAGLDVRGVPGGLTLYCDDQTLVETERLLRSVGLRTRECLLRTGDEPIDICGTVEDQARVANETAYQISSILQTSHLWQ